MHRCKHIPQPLKADPQAKAVVRASTSPTREKLFFKISFPSKNFKNANTQPDRKTFGQLVAKLNIDKDCKSRTTRTPGHNRVDGPADFSTGSASHTTVRTGHVYGGSPMDGDTSKYISKKDT